MITKKEIIIMLTDIYDALWELEPEVPEKYDEIYALIDRCVDYVEENYDKDID